MKRFSDIAAQGWLHVAPRFLPFADAASDELVVRLLVEPWVLDAAPCSVRTG